MSNPFDRNKTKEAKLGEVITEIGEQNQRDAVHIAVVPIKAHARLRPAESIGVSVDGKTTEYSISIGIVDPFLTKNVEPGETFWLFLYQGSVNTLRHEWTHPAFPSTATSPIKDNSKDMSIFWLQGYAMRFNSYYDPEKAYELLLDDIQNKTITYRGTDMHSRGDLVSEKELQYHAEVVLGRKINFDDFIFSCSC